MAVLTQEQKEKKKELAKYKRKVLELAGVMHDIVEDTIWVDYTKLPELSEKISVAMKDLNSFKQEYPYLK